jgi:hypothetical protein
MQATTFATARTRVMPAVALLLGVGLLSGPQALGAGAKQRFSAAGTFVEGCSCSAPCPCELTGVAHGCTGVGALSLTGGSYQGRSLAGAKIVYATAPGDWVRLYVDAATPQQRAAAEAFGRAVYSAFGKIESVKPAHIALTGSAGSYSLSVDNGKIMKLTTKPVLGGNGRTPIVINNIHDPVHPTVMQGKTVSGSYNDGDHSFTLKDSNSYFNDRMRGQGKL